MNPLMITASALVIGAIFASAALARDTRNCSVTRLNPSASW